MAADLSQVISGQMPQDGLVGRCQVLIITEGSLSLILWFTLSQKPARMQNLGESAVDMALFTPNRSSLPLVLGSVLDPFSNIPLTQKAFCSLQYCSQNKVSRAQPSSLTTRRSLFRPRFLNTAQFISKAKQAGWYLPPPFPHQRQQSIFTGKSKGGNIYLSSHAHTEDETDFHFQGPVRSPWQHPMLCGDGGPPSSKRAKTYT